MKVGDKLWWGSIGNSRGTPYEVTVTKVGRLWVYLSNDYRIDTQTLQGDGNGYSSPGCCWLSKEAYDDEVEARRVLSLIRDAVGYGKAPCDAATAHQVAVLLKVDTRRKQP